MTISHRVGEVSFSSLHDMPSSFHSFIYPFIAVIRWTLFHSHYSLFNGLACVISGHFLFSLLSILCRCDISFKHLANSLLPPQKHHLNSFLDHHHFRPHHIILSPLLYVYVGYTDTSLRYPYTLLIIIPSYFHFLSLPLCSSLSLWVYAVVDHSFDHIISAICHVLTCALLLYNLL